MITDTINQQIAEAMKARDEIRLSTLRLLSSALNYEFIAKQHQLTEEEELEVVRREAKKRKDAIIAYEQAGAKDRAEKEKAELEILQAFLPPEMSDEELEKIVDAAIKEADLPAEATPQALQAGMGRVIGAVMGKVKGMAEGAKVAELVKAKLSR